MKAYTDIKQSKKLAQILQIESADMFWADGERPAVWNNKDIPLDETDIHCWSLAALFDVLHFPTLCYYIEDGEGGWIVSCEKDDKGYLSYYRDNPVDTCYEMILKLHEQKLL